jgi:hypothetical protein
MVHASPLSRHRLARGEASSSSANGTPDCHRNRQNRTIRFAKPDRPVFPISSRSFWLLCDSCGNKFWWLSWGIDYFKHVKHEGWKFRPQWIRPRQGQHPQTHLRHLDGGGSQGVWSILCQSWRALPFTLLGDVTRDCSRGHYADRLHQPRGNTWGTA